MNATQPSIARSNPAAVAAAIAVLASALAGCSTLSDLQGRLTKPAAAAKEAPAVAAQPAKPAPLPDPEPAKKTKLYEWTGDGRSVTRIVVNVDEQKARFYEGEKEVGWTTVASGVSRYPTPVGSFSVQEKVANKESNLYGKVYGKGGQLISSNAKMGKTPIPDGARFDGADMPYFLRLTGDGIGMHAGPIPRPGRPASHGCIRMPKAFAPIAFRHVGIGTQVSIVGKGPSYSAYLAQQRASAPRLKPAAQAPTQGPTQPPGATPEQVAQAPASAVPDALSAGAAAVSPIPGAAQGTPPPAQPNAPVAVVTPDAPKVPAVAHDPEPAVAPAIATRTEPAQTQVPPGPGSAPAVVPVQPGHAGVPALSQVPVAAPASKPGAGPASRAPAAAVPSVPTTVYYPTPQVPGYRAPVQAPAVLPPGAAVAVQPAAPTQAGATAKPPAAEPKAQAQPAANVQSKESEQSKGQEQPAAPAQSATPAAQGAG
jgi:lipoprotein-anchoring transpeptidase ErfK/SrfK